MTYIMPGKKTKFKIMQAAIQLAKDSHYSKVLVIDIVELADVSVGALHYHYKSIQALRDELMTWAVENSILEIIGQGVSDKHPLCQNLSMEMKLKALNSLAA